ncbi:retrovirus-related pol polyprotein from transposon TNT 1-94 [Tanacetum coccineum]
MAKASPTQAWLSHRRLSHLNFDTINLLFKNDIVTGLPKFKYVKDQLCSSYEMGKAKRSSFKTKTVPSSKGWLLMLHMDLCGPIRVESINGKKYKMDEGEGGSVHFCGIFYKSKGYRVYNKRTKLIVKSNHINFDEIKEMALIHNNHGPTPQRQMTSDDNTSSLAPQLQISSSGQHDMTIGIHDHSNEPSSLKLVPNVSPTADKTDSSLLEL